MCLAQIFLPADIKPFWSLPTDHHLQQYFTTIRQCGSRSDTGHIGLRGNFTICKVQEQSTHPAAQSFSLCLFIEGNMLKPAVLSSFTKVAFGGQNPWSQTFLFALYFVLQIRTCLYCHHCIKPKAVSASRWPESCYTISCHSPNQIILNHHKPSSSFRSTLCTCSQWNKARQNLGPIRRNSFWFNFLIDQTRHKQSIQLQVTHKPRFILELFFWLSGNKSRRSS